ncbi:hypothetical protein [Bosea sp. LjRoot237]|uniref:hypothetical protein n=1 Tax=Bosea sp. LjRoot237 TaxID=3342292 RepID=UPI003ED13CF7
MSFTRARVVVSFECDLDAVPGWGHTPTDGWIQLFTESALRQSHYNVTAEVLRIDEMRKEFVDGKGYKAPTFPALTLTTNTAPGYAGHSGAHTPGLKQGRVATPLSVRGGPGYGNHNGIAVQDARGYVAAVAINDVPELDAPALAHLIAAAPDVVEHAKRVMALLAKHGPSIVPHLMDSDDNAGQRLRDALAKAEGRS